MLPRKLEKRRKKGTELPVLMGFFWIVLPVGGKSRGCRHPGSVVRARRLGALPWEALPPGTLGTEHGDFPDVAC